MAAAAAGACGGAQESPVFPSDFEPGPPLGDPPRPDPGAPGVDYLTRVAPRFGAPWGAFLGDLRMRLPPTHELNRPSLSALLLMEIDEQGDLVAMRLAATSGSHAFDEAALEVAREAVPLPHPPADLLSDDDRLHLEWRFSRDERQAGPATARVQRVAWPLERALPALLERGRIGEAARRVATAARTGAGSALETALVAGLRQVCTAVVAHALASDDTTRQVSGVAVAVAAHLIATAPALRRLASGSMDPAVRRAALLALGQLGDRAAVPLLRQTALMELGQGSENSSAAAAALLAMGEDAEVRAATAQRLRSATEVGRSSALSIMAQVPVPEAVPDLIALLRSSGREPRAERITAAAALGAVAAQRGEGAGAAMAALTDCLAVADAAQRAACAQAIGRAVAAVERGAPTYRKVTALLRDRDERVRAAATRAAALLDPERFARVLASLPREPSDLVLTAQAEGLARVPGKRALARLARLAESPSSSVRLAAVSSLLQRSEPRAAEILAGLAEHGDVAMRALALRGERRPAALRTALRDSAPEVRAAALAALVAREGRWRTLPEAAEMIAATPAESEERLWVARAWLAP
jgi:TonB family protein